MSDRALRDRIKRLLEKWNASIAYGRGGTAQHNDAVRWCILDLSVALEDRAARPSPQTTETR